MKLFKTAIVSIGSGITAFMILNFFLSFYYRLPVHIHNSAGTTDYMWEAGGTWIKLTEGISWGKMDAAGFTNSAVVENPDIVILGSSHMEATNVFQKENTSALVQSYLGRNTIPLSVYNRGISGHHFLKCCKYLNKNTARAGLKYAVIETAKVQFISEEIDRLLNDEIDFTESHDSGILFCLQKLPFFRLMWFQFEHGLLDLFLPKNTVSAAGKTPEKECAELISKNYEKLFSYIVRNANGKKIVIFYHPAGHPKADGNLEYETDSEYLKQFSTFAEKYGIEFIDLTAGTETLWKNGHKTTHGFCTGTAFSGHLNKNGHKLAAKKIAECIMREEHRNVAF